MLNSHTSFGKLKQVIVGRELNLPKRIVDITFKQFYKEAIGQEIYEHRIDGYYINSDLIQLRNQQLDNLAKLLESLNVKVYRPKVIDKVIKIQTPVFKSEVSSASNVRDISWIYCNKIIETPTYVRNRYFENMALYSIFNECFDNGNGGQWIKAPNTQLSEQSIDLDDWKKKRDFSNINKRYEMAIDGAQFLRIGKDVIVNVTTYNHYLGFKWIKSFFPETNFHMISIADNHLDGAINCLKPGVFICDPKYKNIKDLLPAKFQKWNFIFPSDFTQNIDIKNMTDIDIRLASSRGMDINILSIDEKTVIVYDRAIGVIKELEKNGFDVIPFKLDNGEIFAGGIHCSTLDIERKDEFIDYGK